MKRKGRWENGKSERGCRFCGWMGERACDFILGRNRAVIARASRALCGRKMHTLPAASSSSRPLGHFLCHAKLGAHLSVVFQRGTPAASDQALRVSPPLIFLINHSTIFVSMFFQLTCLHHRQSSSPPLSGVRSGAAFFFWGGGVRV